MLEHSELLAFVYIYVECTLPWQSQQTESFICASAN